MPAKRSWHISLGPLLHLLDVVVQAQQSRPCQHACRHQLQGAHTLRIAAADTWQLAGARAGVVKLICSPHTNARQGITCRVSQAQGEQEGHGQEERGRRAGMPQWLVLRWYVNLPLQPRQHSVPPALEAGARHWPCSHPSPAHFTLHASASRTPTPFTLRVFASRMPMRAVSASEVAAPIWCPTEASTLCT